ncbi:sugar-transfer associated ATP-grasp domain-containing protein [Enterocloster citroniae]|uniref:sugar-transfer associated ATP-grasp domain-containing protein n=1 Tax=Enterocloster citroniae TaxID=358743 RepID=UPI00349EB9A0
MTNYESLLEEVRKSGMDYRWAKMFVKKLSDDEKAFPVSDNEKKRWALERGFYPGRIELYGLTEDNYRDYMPDYNYFMLHPINNHFLKWLDKTTLKYVLNSNGCESVMPDYYIYIENDGSYTYLMNCPFYIKKDRDFLLNLLRDKGVLAMKPNSGTSGGLGFIKLEQKDDGIYENNKLIDMDRFAEIRDSMRNYIVTEYAHQHTELAKVWPDSECTLRVIMVKDPREDLYKLSTWSCAVSYARFGTSVNGGASNLSSGGVGVGFDFETGKYEDFCIRYKRYTSDGIWHLEKHPDTSAEWRTLGLPNWSYVKDMIHDICQHISSLDYLGLDIIITENGMKLCEINSHPAIDYEQVMCGPTLARERVRKFFECKGLHQYDGDTFYQAYIKSQE